MAEDLPEKQWRADLDGVAWCLGRWNELDERSTRTTDMLTGPR
jgi:hypothetical protein